MVSIRHGARPDTQVRPYKILSLYPYPRVKGETKRQVIWMGCASLTHPIILSQG